ncbi:glycosyltransferase family 4 protein [Aliivibrio fischeri]|uniref:glycosyltransferase family 4 protein n=1 Tax=Aliivibrio fischeri TaxID=668 RepID=UPI0012DAE4FF|nr:glycosyltransferase family 4 protein [Aliivibrio fischeri]MUK67977.1 glycosyltransferase [Aliivibrio fischeri]MUK72924.1 glycosyltransferase [Aliivibrio fischeri]
MKIKFVSNLYPSKNKPYKGTFVRNVFEGFKSQGSDVSLLTLRDSSDRKLNKLIDYMLFTWRAFVSGLLSNESDIHYIHYTSHSSLGLIIASLFKSKNKLCVVSNVHGSDILPGNSSIFSRIKVMLSKKILDKSVLVISPSGYFKHILSEEYAVPEKKIIVSPSGGVDSSIFKPSNFVQKEFTFGYVGRLEENKGIFELLEAFRSIQQTNPTSTLLFVGSGSREAQLKEIASSMSGVTILKGVEQGELVSVYQSIKFLVFPSKASESLGLIPIEAMMCGTPVLSSTVGATKDYIVSDMRTLSFEPGNINELKVSLSIATQMSDIDYCRFSKLAIETANSYSSNKVIEDLYRVLMSRFI